VPLSYVQPERARTCMLLPVVGVCLIAAETLSNT